MSVLRGAGAAAARIAGGLELAEMRHRPINATVIAPGATRIRNFLQPLLENGITYQRIVRWAQVIMSSATGNACLSLTGSFALPSAERIANQFRCELVA